MDYRVEKLRNLRDLACEDGLDSSQLPNGARQRVSVSRGNRGLSGGIDLGQYKNVRRGEHLDEIIKEVAGAAESMRLKHKHHATIGIGTTHRLQGGTNLGRMVAIVIHEVGQPTRKGHGTAVLEPPTDPSELIKRTGNCCRGQAEFTGHPNGGKRIEHIVMARQIESQGPIGLACATHGKPHPETIGLKIDRLEIRLGRDTIG